MRLFEGVLFFDQNLLPQFYLLVLIVFQCFYDLNWLIAFCVQ